jgi:hypothetical protein
VDYFTDAFFPRFCWAEFLDSTRPNSASFDEMELVGNPYSSWLEVSVFYGARRE